MKRNKTQKESSGICLKTLNTVYAEFKHKQNKMQSSKIVVHIFEINCYWNIRYACKYFHLRSQKTPRTDGLSAIGSDPSYSSH